MNRTTIIQTLIDKIDAKSYLEIGVDNGKNFRDIKCKYKVGVDPAIQHAPTFCLTSDEFFEQNTDRFDVVFVDGLHHADQVYRDITNSIEVLNEGGYIICHDMNPLKEEHQVVPFTGGTWNGDCWKALVKLRQERNDLVVFTVNVDHGCSVIQLGKQEPLQIDTDINYKNFELHRKEWLNLISADEFCRIIGIDTYNIGPLLHAYINDPNSATTNWDLGLYYDSIGQTASAVSFYLRTAERTEDTLLKYECLLRSALCFERQGARNFTVRGLLQHAVSIEPTRPEGYFLLSRHYERQTYDGHWNDCYTVASIGNSVASLNSKPLRTNVEYPAGSYGLLFEMAVSSWWCGLCDESRDLFTKLYLYYALDDAHYTSVHQNLKFLNSPIGQHTPFTIYRFYERDKLNYKFSNCNLVHRNYSEAFQDMFVLSLFDGKQYGTYLEIGAGHPVYGNNTYLLQDKFNWNGVSIDYDSNIVDEFNKIRQNSCLHLDATTIVYDEFIPSLYGDSDYIDYLQIDCDPSEVSYQILLRIDFDRFKFGVITFEHDGYANTESEIPKLSRELLSSKGYIPIRNISPDGVRWYEDWWVNPNVALNKDVFNVMQNRSSNLHVDIINAKDLFIDNFINKQ